AIAWLVIALGPSPAHWNTHPDYEQKGRRLHWCGTALSVLLGSNLFLAFNQEMERLSDPDLLDEVREPFLRRRQREGTARLNEWPTVLPHQLALLRGNSQSGTDVAHAHSDRGGRELDRQALEG